MNGQFNFQSRGNAGGGSNNIMYYGVVIDNNDPYEARRIKVRVESVDDTKTDDNLDWVFPLLPKFFTIVPKVGELILLIIPTPDTIHVDRFYVGSLIPQDPNLFYSDVSEARNALNTRGGILGTASRNVPESKGVFPDGSDLTIQGRKDTEIRFNTSEMLIRVGKEGTTEKEGVPVLNTINQTYISLRHNVSLYNSDKTFSVMNLVSDKINLLTHEGGDPFLNLNGGDEPISEDVMLQILEQAHPVPYGDRVIEYLNLMKDVLINHTHAYSGTKTCNVAGEFSIKKLQEYDINTTVSKNIKIN